MSEEGTAPLRAMLNADIKLLDCGDDTLTYEELIENYAEAWDRIVNEKAADGYGLRQVLEREGELGFHPSELYFKPPFSTISRLMEKEGLSTTDVGMFLRWKAKADNVKEARAAKAKKRKKADPAAKGRSFFMKKKHSLREL